MSPGVVFAPGAVGLAAEPGGIAVVEVAGVWSAAPGEVLLELDAPGGARRAAALAPPHTDAAGRWSARYAVRREVLQAAHGCALVSPAGEPLAALEVPRPAAEAAPSGSAPDPAALRFDLGQRLAAERRPQVAAGIRRLLAGLGEPEPTVPVLTARLGATEERLRALQSQAARERGQAEASLARVEAAERRAAELVAALGRASNRPPAS